MLGVTVEPGRTRAWPSTMDPVTRGEPVLDHGGAIAPHLDLDRAHDRLVLRVDDKDVSTGLILGDGRLRDDQRLDRL